MNDREPDWMDSTPDWAVWREPDPEPASPAGLDISAEMLALAEAG